MAREFTGEPVGCWRPVVHEALDGDSVLFSFSDRAVQEKKSASGEGIAVTRRLPGFVGAGATPERILSRNVKGYYFCRNRKILRCSDSFRCWGCSGSAWRSSVSSALEPNSDNERMRARVAIDGLPPLAGRRSNSHL